MMKVRQDFLVADPLSLEQSVSRNLNGVTTTLKMVFTSKPYFVFLQAFLHLASYEQYEPIVSYNTEVLSSCKKKQQSSFCNIRKPSVRKDCLKQI